MTTSPLIPRNFSELREGLPEERFGRQEPEPSLRVREDLKKLLGPLVPALLQDCCGALDVSKIKAKDFAEFKDFLKTQAALNDQKSFRDPYASLLGEEKFEPLVKLLFQEIDAEQFVSLPMIEAEALIREFQGRLIEIDANSFAQSHINSPKGRDFLRHVLNDRAHFSLEQRADLVKAIGRWDDDANPQEDANYGYLIGRRLSLWNYFNWGVVEDEVEQATGLALSALDQVDENEKLANTAPTIHGALSLDAAKLERMQKIAKSQSLDPRSEVRARLAELWLSAANTHRLAEGLDGKAYGLNRYVMERTESFLKQAESLNSDEGLNSFNEELQDFLGGPLKQGDESSVFAWAKHQIAGGGLDDLFAEQASETRRPFERLKKLSDEWNYALDCDERILQGPTQSSLDDPKLQEATSRLIQGLQKTKRELWYGYKQHRAVSRLASNVANVASVGDIADIRQANALLDQCIARLASAKDGAAIEREIEFLYGQLKEDGLLNQAFAAAEMEGVEQLLGLAQTTALIAATTYATRGLNVAAIGGIAVVRGAGAINYLRSVIVGIQGLRATAAAAEGVEAIVVSDRIAKGFAWGTYISTAENVVAASSGEVRPGQEKLGDWFKDALSTGAAMSLSGGLPVSHAAEGALPRQMIARYTQGGIRGVGRLGLDVTTEIAEESFDQYARQALDGKTQALSFAQLEEISKLSSLGGFTKVGMVAEAIRGKASSPTQSVVLEPQSATHEPPQKTIKPKPSRILTHPLLSPMWALLGADGLGGIPIARETKPATVSLIERRNHLFDRLVQSALPGQEVQLVSYLLEHSIEDGILLADRLRLTPLQWEEAVWNEAFAFKHPEVCQIMIETIKSRGSIKRIAKSFLEALQSAVDSADPELMRHQGFQGRTQPPSDLKAEIDGYYLDAFLTRKPIKPATPQARTSGGTESLGQRTAHRYLEELASVFERRFYTGPIRRLLSAHVEDPLFQDSTVTEEELGKFCGRHGINFEEIAAQLNSARVVAFRPLHQLKQNAVKQALISELNSETPGMRVELDFESDRYRLVEIEEDLSLEETQDPVKERLAAFENRILDEMEYLLDQEVVPKDLIASNLAGLDSKRAWDLRERLLNEVADIGRVVSGLAGLDSDQAWKMRQRLLKDGASKDSVVESLAGLDSDLSWVLRHALIEDGASQDSLAKGLAGLDSGEAWEIREDLLKYRQYQGPVAAGLAGLDSERAWEMRERLMEEKANQGVVAQGLVGLDSERAWKIRNRALLQEPNLVAWGLAGLDSDRAWKIREGLLGDRTQHYWVLAGLAGVNSKRAWELRERLKGTHWIAPSLAGDYVSFVWRLRPEWHSVKKTQSSVKKDLARFENRVLDTMEQFLKTGPYTDLVVSHLAGLDSERAWKMRNRALLQAPNYVAQGLAGLDSERAWKIRESLLGDRTQDYWVLAGLAGLDSKRAWEMREQLLEKGTIQKGMLAQSLAGLDSERAWKMREHLLNQGASKNWVAIGLAALDSERAWEMRERLLKEQADQGSVAVGLAGLESERAWTMRERLLKEGANKGLVAQGLSGLDSERAWEMRERLLKEGANVNLVAKGLAGVDSERAWEMRQRLEGPESDPGMLITSLAGDNIDFTWRLRPELQGPAEAESEGLQLLNLVHRPSLTEIQKYFDAQSPAKTKKPREKEALRPHVAKILSDPSQMDRDTARSLLRTNPAVPDRAPAELARQLILRILPRLAPSPPSLGSYLKDRILGKGSAPIDSLSGAFQEQSNVLLQGAGFQEIQDQRPLLQSRQAMEAFLVSGVYGRFNAKTGHWEKTYFPARHQPSGPGQENTLTLLDVKNAGRISLPLPHDGQLISERVRGFTAQGREIPLKPIVNSLGEAAVDVPAEVVKVLYSIEQPLVPSIMADIGEPEFSAFPRGLEKEVRRDLTARLARLPLELSAELRSRSFLALSPKKKVQRIEAMVREVSWYDLHNEEVSEYKKDKTPEEQLMIAEQRMKALRDRDPSIPPHKRLAGVCTDFALLTIALLREAGIPAGLLAGIDLKGQEAQVRHHHATAFVPWPDDKGGLRIVPVDGTPSAIDAAQPSSRPSLAEAETQAQEESATQAAASKAAIADMLKEAKAESVESIEKLKNGQLERALNVILQHEVKRSHVRAIRRALEAYWYHGLDRRPMNESEFSQFLLAQMIHERATTSEKERLEPAGALLMRTLREFLGKFQRGQAAKSSQEALKLLEHVTALARPGLSEVELRALTAAIAYLRADSMQASHPPTLHAFAAPALLGADFMLHGQWTLSGAILAGIAALASSAFISGIFSRHPFRKNAKEDIALSSRGKELLTQLREGKPEAKIKAAEALMDMGEIGAIPELRDMMNRRTEPHSVRVSAITALSHLRAHEAIDDLKIILNRKDEEQGFRIQAGVILFNWGEAEGILGLQNMIRDSQNDHWTRTLAMDILVEMDASAAIAGLRDDLRKVLHNRMENYSLRMKAAKSLWNLRDHRVLEDLRQITADTNLQGSDANQSAQMRRSASEFIEQMAPYLKP